MTSEYRRKMMQQTLASDYIGAHFKDQNRVLLVSVDPDEPWEAFRQLRRRMRRERHGGAASMSLFHSESPINHAADVIPLASRRRAG